MRYWLVKSEPSEYSIADLARDGEEIWDGVRNYQARNFLREMAVGDRLFYYHSNTKPPGIVGLAEVTESDIVDPTQFDPQDKHYDPKSKPESPRWRTVRLKYVATFGEMIALDVLKATFTPEELVVVRRGNRLSVMPVPEATAVKLLGLAGLE
ncbi:MAG: EVE domain-containing protein [Spirulina sp. SIO3F2]|nr:EVE domain-containing protein [Spirulina sp. SIO3F2]